MSSDSCAHCVSGEIHSGEPTGTLTSILGLQTYIAKASHPSGKVILFLHDGFGVPFVNNRLLADTYAAETGATVYIPDFFEGDAVPIQVMVEKLPFDFMVWKDKHPKEHCRKLVTDFLTELKAHHGVTNVVTIGFCWGGWPSLELAGTDLIDAAAVAHPSMVEFPKDIENISKPTLFLCAETDQQFPLEKRELSEQILQKKGLPAKFVLYPGTTHGFAIRGNRDADPVVAKACVDAKNEAVKFFKAQLHL